MEKKITNKRVLSEELKKCFESIAVEHKNTISIIEGHNLLSHVMAIIGLIGFSFVIPISPLIISFFFNTSSDTVDVFKITGICFNSYLFKYSWGIGFVSFLISAGILVHKEEKNKEKVLNNKYFDYYFIYLTVEELKKYLLSNRNEHIASASLYYKIYVNNGHFYDRIHWLYKNFDFDEDRTSVFKWIKLDEETSGLLKELIKLGPFIYQKISHKEDYNILISALEKVVEYEYHVLKVSFSENFSITNQLFDIVEDLKRLKPLEKKQAPQEAQTQLSISKKFLLAIERLHLNKNIFISFASWLISLQIITFLIALIWVNTCKIDIDSKIVAGIFATSTICATTLSVSIFKNK